ncbi:ketoacyl-ACP synthase III family protein [Streptomyces rishiriensis]|uniref:ketoacyl-ACP synthase III family protein n=1 Tax=Streptomyces rishiriensis TaxID=68264 RepID=UPI0037D31D7D
MRWNDVYVDAAAVWAGRREDVRLAVAEGRYSAEEREADDYAGVSVVDDMGHPDMAVEAARIALKRTWAPHEHFDLVAHVTSVGYQGLDHWTPASYIQARTVGGRGSAVQLQQASNGAIAAIDLAAAHLTVRPSPCAALITTCDKYQPPMFDRYRSDKGLPRGDGATALVLTRGSGVARLLSTSVVSDTTHEGAYRGTRPWAAEAGGHGWPIDMRQRLKEYLGSGADVADLARSLRDGQQEAMDRAMAEADVEVKDIARFVYAHAGRAVVDWDLIEKVSGISVTQTTWDFGRELGHLGAGDQIAGLSHLLESKAVGLGDKVVLSGVGAGFVFGCAVLEITAEPAWS